MVPGRITEENLATLSGGSDLIFRRNAKRVSLIFSTDAGPVFVFIDRALVGGNQGIMVNTGNTPVVLTAEHIGESIKGEVRAVSAPGLRLTAYGVTAM